MLSQITYVLAGIVDGIREATVFAGVRRVRPALMTTATTLLALLPVLTSTPATAYRYFKQAIDSNPPSRWAGAARNAMAALPGN